MLSGKKAGRKCCDQMTGAVAVLQVPGAEDRSDTVATQAGDLLH